MQEISDIIQDIPQLKGARYYLAVPDGTQHWQMAIFDKNTGKWRPIDFKELENLARQMK